MPIFSFVLLIPSRPYKAVLFDFITESMNMIDHSDICFGRICENGCKVGSVTYDKPSSHSAPTHPALYFHWVTLAGLQRQGEEPHSETPMERGWEPPVLTLTVSLLPTPSHLSKSVQTLQLYNLTQEHWFNLCTPSLIVPEKSNHSLGCRQENFIPDHPNATQTHTHKHRVFLFLKGLLQTRQGNYDEQSQVSSLIISITFHLLYIFPYHYLSRASEWSVLILASEKYCYCLCSFKKKKKNSDVWGLEEG